MLNFGEGSSVPGGEEVEYLGTWMPATPEKPFSTRSDLTPHDMQTRLRRGDWLEQSQFPNALVQGHDSLAYIRAADDFGQPDQLGRDCRHHIGNASLAEMSRMVADSRTRHGYEGCWEGSFLNCDLAGPVASSSGSLRGAVRPEWMPPTSSLRLDSLANDWRESHPTNLMVPTPNCSSSSHAGGYYNSFQLSNHCFELPHYKYDMNLSPGEVDAASIATSRIEYTPVTPGKAKRLEDSEYSAGVNLLTVKHLGEEKSKQLELVISKEKEGNEHSSNKMVDNTVEISSGVVSTPLKETEDPEKEGDQFIDLNKTPSKKPQRRRKHRPKVIVEGKPKRTPKAESTKYAESSEGTANAVGKRKYTRKRDLERPDVEHVELVGEITNSRTGRRKYAEKEGMFEPASQDSESIAEAKSPRARKRKYMWKKGVGQPASPQAEPVGETTNPISGKRNYAYRSGTEVPTTQFIGETTWLTTGTAAKSCRRTLSLDLENTSDGGQGHVAAKQIEILNNKSLDFSLHTCFVAAKKDNAAYIMHKTKPDLQMNQMNGLPAENRQSESVNGLANSTNQMTSSHILFSGTQAVTLQVPQTEGMLMDSIIPNPIDLNDSEVGQIECPEKTSSEGLGGIKQIMQQNNPQYYSSRGENSKRDHYNIEQSIPIIANPSRSAQFWPEIFQVNNYQQHCSFLYAGTSDSHKRKTIEGEIQANPVVKPSDNQGSRPKPKDGDDANETGSASARTYDMVNLQSKYDKSKAGNNSKIDKFINDLYAHPVTCRETVGSTEVHELVSLTALKSCKAVTQALPEKGHTLQQWSQPKTSDAEIRSSEWISNISKKGRTPRRMPLGQEISNNHQLLPAKRKGRPPKRKFFDPIEEIICRIGVLSLDGRSKDTKQKEKNALVPYIGNGAIVPYNFMKKQKPRPKVDLDPETDRVWKLLMWKEGSEGLQGTENDKEKWWEEERRIFNLRVDSFIARMHLVQGDRRFSRWKGSVVDSVIGVFLTQNVSDHLSSSAFMSLVARYPPKSRRNRTYGGNGSNLAGEKPDAHVLSQSDTIKFQEKLLCYPLHDSMTLHNLEEEVLSSQESLESCITQGHGGVGSNSEVEDPAPGCTLNNSQVLSFTDLLQMDSSIFFDEFYSLSTESSLSHEVYSQGHQPLKAIEYGQQNPRMETPDSLNYSAFSQEKGQTGSQRQEAQDPPRNYRLLQSEKSFAGEEEVKACKFFSEERTSLPSTAFRFIEEKSANSTTERVAQEAYALRNSQHSSAQPYHERNNIQFQITTSAMAENLAEEVAKGDNKCYRQQISNIPSSAGEVFDVEERISMVAGKTSSDNKLIAQTSKEQVHSSSKEKADASTNASSARKGKAKHEKNDAFDWDSLRKQVQADGIKEKSEDTMDSLDYEALRCASVKEVSEAIKERGMNNMLAERIKEFLNRLVSDHGSTDLEWLRDIPHDKAKDYLLSIRGLGLKSVECVRLLTLHHLAFPVDTNVGRIAVRLGWVPLQPLPESLQLHLLELYPILETVQKYLWPRLCKLNRETLYELHYQMITFGKVFCTKSRPNCNACPLRAECRHFASAFASARLALPGPEEKRITTTSTVPSVAEIKTGTAGNPLLLPMPEENSFERAGSEIGSCIPIVEEPATPDHHHHEVTESDIEDAFYDDPDEIPTIKLNMEEFSMSLQNYMQENSDIQEGDISKALVVLNPAIASIPVPKLKNVNRLRTEHQVYELPDSHPLLDRMDRREPDDPSPYLLAIWTPGETANSTEPPKQQCQYKETERLCNEKTCFSCNSIREADSQTVRGTLLIPCRTAMRGSFPLNGTYFQVNEVLADHESSLNPIDVPRAWIWNLPRRVVYFGTTVSTIFRGLSTEAIQHCFWKGFVCVRGFDRKSRAPRPLKARLHLAASKMVKKTKDKE